MSPLVLKRHLSSHGNPSSEAPALIEGDRRQGAVDGDLAAVKHAYTHFRITLTAFGCTPREGTPTGSPWRWAGTGELEELPFSKADRLIARFTALKTDH
jgi:hypothetical protein